MFWLLPIFSIFILYILGFINLNEEMLIAGGFIFFYGICYMVGRFSLLTLLAKREMLNFIVFFLIFFLSKSFLEFFLYIFVFFFLLIKILKMIYFNFYFFMNKFFNISSKYIYFFEKKNIDFFYI